MNYRICFLANLLTESAEQQSLSATRDLDYIQSRVEHEGLSFLTITLPSFCDGLEAALERGFAIPSDFKAFARRSKGCLPKFLSGFMRKVFEDDGSLKPDCDVDCIYLIRQISRYYKKALLPCSSERERKAELQYVRTDLELSYHESQFDANISLHLTRVASIIARSIGRSYDRKLPSCFHGPGATAERYLRNERNLIRSWPIRAEPYFPASWHTIPNAGWFSNSRRTNGNESDVTHARFHSIGPSDRKEGCESPVPIGVRTRVRTTFGPEGCLPEGRPPTSRRVISNDGHGGQFQGGRYASAQEYDLRAWKLEFLSEAQEPPVKVVFVPKTLKTPRVIAIEPSHMQYMQQGIMRWLVPWLERNPLTRNSVHFTDQSINRESARVASIDRQYATIDLSEASDRVSLKLVELIFADSGIFLPSILACRSKTAQIPSGDIVQLNKFASMGSALCFPIEALVFYVLIQSAVHKKLGIRPSSKSIENLSRYLHVYGDDIIVPCAWLADVVEELEAFGLKVNVNKSFHKSHFRESCGGDYYNGYDVKPSYFRVDPSRLNSQLTMNEVMSLSEHSNQLYLKGLWRSAQSIRDFIERKLRRRIPRRSYPSEGVVFHSAFINTYSRWNRRLQRLESKTAKCSTLSQPDDISSIGAACVMAGLRNIGNDLAFDFTSSVRPRVLRRKLGWIA